MIICNNSSIGFPKYHGIIKEASLLTINNAISKFNKNFI